MAAVDLTPLIERYRIGLAHASDHALAHEAARYAALPGDLAATMRHLIDAEAEYRRAQQHAADTPQPAEPRPGPAHPWPDPAPIRPVVDPRYAEAYAHLDACRRDRRAAREARLDLERAVAEARRVCGPAPLAEVA